MDERANEGMNSRASRDDWPNEPMNNQSSMDDWANEQMNSQSSTDGGKMPPDFRQNSLKTRI